MRIVDMGDAVFLFMFDPPPGEFEGQNQLAIVEGSTAFLIDAGYKENMAQVLEWLTARGAKPVGALVSHYHPDHADGLALLPGLETWGSEAFAQTLARCFRPERHKALEPGHLIAGNQEIRFQGHAIEAFPLPGHSPDSLCAVIDDRLVYAADSLLFTNEGLPVLPSIHARPISLHAEAIRRLGDYLGLVFIPGHGAPVLDRGARERDLANRLAYIEAIADRPGISLEEAEARCEPKFLGEAWHEENWS